MSVARHNPEIVAACDACCVPEAIRFAVVSAYHEFAESDDNDPCLPHSKWRLSGDAYAEFLDGWQVGHRKLSTWIREREAGEAVTLTRKGVALFDALKSAERAAWQRALAEPVRQHVAGWKLKFSGASDASH